MQQAANLFKVTKQHWYAVITVINNITVYKSVTDLNHMMGGTIQRMAYSVVPKIPQNLQLPYLAVIKSEIKTTFLEREKYDFCMGIHVLVI